MKKVSEDEDMTGGGREEARRKSESNGHKTRGGVAIEDGKRGRRPEARWITGSEEEDKARGGSEEAKRRRRKMEERKRREGSEDMMKRGSPEEQGKRRGREEARRKKGPRKRGCEAPERKR